MAARTLVSRTCTLAEGGPAEYRSWPRAAVSACGKPAAAVLTFACVHEHIDTPSGCAACVAGIQRVAGMLICPRCEAGPQSHECHATLSIRWLSTKEASHD
jgi:hypothetical protein